MKAFTIIIIFAFVFSLNINTNAQRKGGRKTKPQPKVEIKPIQRTEYKFIIPQPQYSTQPFDVSVTSLPANYVGNNVKEIYNRLAEIEKKSTKGEFETTEQFRQRITTEETKPIIGSLNRQSIFAFTVKEFILQSKYDADNQLMNVKADFTRVQKGAKSFDFRKRSLLWDIESRAISSYSATNAYGAQVTVKRKVSDLFHIAFDNYEKFPVIKNDLAGDFIRDIAFSTEIKMDVQKAMKAKENLRLLIVCQLVTPYTIEAFSYIEPTVSSPTEQVFRSYSLNTEILEFWIFDASTGEVYLKQKPN